VIEREGRVVTDDGVELYYTSLGDGPQIVCVLAGFYFEKDFAALAAGRTFVYLHQRGRGLSRVPEGAVVDIRHEAADIETVRTALGIERWSLIGWSYMGTVTSLYAIEHPSALVRPVHLCSLGPDQST